MRRPWKLLSLFSFTLVVAVLLSANVSSGASATPGSVATPGGTRVILNDQWVYWDELAEGEGFVEVSTEPGYAWVEKTPRGWKIHVRWAWTSHTYVDVQYHNYDGRSRTRRRQPSDIREPTLQN